MGQVKLLGIGKAVPPHFISQKGAAEHAMKYYPPREEYSRLIPALYELTRIDRRASVVLEKGDNGDGVTQRFFADRKGPDDFGPDTTTRMLRYAQEAPVLSLASSREALKQAQVSPEEISQLITVSCTGFSAPGFDIALIKNLGLSRETSRTHVGFMGCHGMFNALRVASSMGQSRPGDKILVCSVEICSLHYSYEESYDRLLSNALFADGSSAAVLSCEGPAGTWSLAQSGSYVFPDSEEVMKWDIGNHGFNMKLSDKVPAILGKNLRPWLERWLEQCGLQLSSIRSWAVHPGGPKILDQIRNYLNLDRSQLAGSYQILAEYGNMSSATILFILDYLHREKAAVPCLALGFGPGLTVEAALFV